MRERHAVYLPFVGLWLILFGTFVTVLHKLNKSDEARLAFERRSRSGAEEDSPPAGTARKHPEHPAQPSTIVTSVKCPPI